MEIERLPVVSSYHLTQKIHQDVVEVAVVVDVSMAVGFVVVALHYSLVFQKVDPCLCTSLYSLYTSDIQFRDAKHDYNTIY